jgi:hypothetical protein
MTKPRLPATWSPPYPLLEYRPLRNTTLTVCAPRPKPVPTPHRRVHWTATPDDSSCDCINPFIRHRTGAQA